MLLQLSNSRCYDNLFLLSGDSFLGEEQSLVSFNVRSDMLESMGMGGAEMYSIRHSIHIGVAPADLRLSPPVDLPPADEDMAKGLCAVHIVATIRTSTV